MMEEHELQARMAKARLQQAFGANAIKSDMTLVEAVEYVIENLQHLAEPAPFFWGNID